MSTEHLFIYSCYETYGLQAGNTTTLRRNNAAFAYVGATAPISTLARPVWRTDSLSISGAPHTPSRRVWERHITLEINSAIGQTGQKEVTSNTFKRISAHRPQALMLRFALGICETGGSNFLSWLGS